MPRTAQKSASLVANNCVRLPNRVSNSRARSTALFPVTPVRKKIASNSASESEDAPLIKSFSRGRSPSGQSVIAIYPPSPDGLFLVNMRSIMEQEKTKRIVPSNRIVLGITGGIAAYKAAELLRLLIKQNIEVQVVMTEAACHFITTTTMQGLSGKTVFTDQWDASVPNSMAHINRAMLFGTLASH